MLTQTTYVIFGRRGSGKTTIRLQVVVSLCLLVKAQHPAASSKDQLA